MDALMRRFRWRGALYRWPGVADEPAGHITTTPLVTSLTHPPRETCAFRPAVRKVTRALESVGFGYVRTRIVMRYTGTARGAWQSPSARRREARHVGVVSILRQAGLTPVEFLKLLD
jgi:hypothetical protein